MKASDIGGFSLLSSFLEGTRHSRGRGLFEQGLLYVAVEEREGIRGGMRNDRAQFRRAEKEEEGMALKIRLERTSSRSSLWLTSSIPKSPLHVFNDPSSITEINMLTQNENL